MKEYITPINVFFFFWGLVLLAISEFYPEYLRYYLYLSNAIIIPVMIISLIKQRKKDKLNDTMEFRFAMYRILIMALMLVIFFFVTKQNHV
ncbi:hypothetical protein [uncultured Flavobacterium sp.]|uniref:hypothetical protein n=1 Tax=uncultured Flavobacterium sp. TaxID=165435 RepID=UPI00292CFB39|nr:hypothetical protein [uncultured Flavobacterium sp.]